jgi:hypothetical protein
MEVHMRTRLLAAAVATAVAIPAAARAGNCESDLTNPIYLQIGDTQQPLIKVLGRALRDNAPHPITLVYVTSGSCTNIDALKNGTAITGTMFYVPSSIENGTWKPSDPPLQCTPGTGHVPDIANSNVFVSACTTDPLPNTITQVRGPVQAYVLAVPEASTETAITAEEAYFVFGFGMLGMVTPWADETQMFIRATTRSTLLSWAYNIGVPAGKWKGTVPGTPGADKSTDVVNALKNSPTPAKAIGILGAEVYDQNRATLNVLAFRTFGQYSAYYPDSDAAKLDKANVRDGHYTVWSPTVYLYPVQAGTTTPTKADAKYVVDLIADVAVSPAANFDPTDAVVSVGLVPDCAMKVTRAFEGGNLAKYAPTEPCGCYFESKVATSTCTACDASTPCASGTCRHGFCEAH